MNNKNTNDACFNAGFVLGALPIVLIVLWFALTIIRVSYTTTSEILHLSGSQ